MRFSGIARRACLLTALAFALPANAQVYGSESSRASFQVSLEIRSECTFMTQPYGASPAGRAMALLDGHCTPSTPYSVGMDTVDVPAFAVSRAAPGQDAPADAAVVMATVIF